MVTTDRTLKNQKPPDNNWHQPAESYGYFQSPARVKTFLSKWFELRSISSSCSVIVRTPPRFASQFLGQQPKQTAPWLFHATACSVYRCMN